MNEYERGYVVLGKTGRTVQLDPITALFTSGQVAILYDTTFESTTRGFKSSNFGAHYKGLIVNVEASADSATNGLEISESDDDGTTWKTVYQHSYVAATDLRFKVPLFTISAPDWRVRFTNGATTQTFFRWSVLGDPFERAV